MDDLSKTPRADKRCYTCRHWMARVLNQLRTEKA